MNKSAQFTPGPWYPHLAKADHCLSSSVWGAEPGNQVAVIGGKSLQTMNANATLIAAAPAMYEALRHAAMSYHHPSCKAQGEYVAQPERYCTCHVQKARYALAQAEGR